MSSKLSSELILNAEQRDKDRAKRIRETPRSKQLRAEAFELMQSYREKIVPAKRTSS
jgi:hypothetical protein